MFFNFGHTPVWRGPTPLVGLIRGTPKQGRWCEMVCELRARRCTVARPLQDRLAVTCDATRRLEGPKLGYGAVLRGPTPLVGLIRGIPKQGRWCEMVCELRARRCTVVRPPQDRLAVTCDPGV